MDEQQKEHVNSISRDLSDSVKALELAEYLVLAKLITKERVDDILVSLNGNNITTST